MPSHEVDGDMAEEETGISQIPGETVAEEDDTDSSDNDDDELGDDGPVGEDPSGIAQLTGKKRQQGIRALRHLLNAKDDPKDVSFRKAETSGWRDLYLEICTTLEIPHTTKLSKKELQSTILKAVSACLLKQRWYMWFTAYRSNTVISYTRNLRT